MDSYIDYFYPWIESRPTIKKQLPTGSLFKYVVFVGNTARQRHSKPYKKMKQWCVDNCTQNWYFFNHMYCFFTDRNDLMRFKLTFL
jgi:hypothetical protein